MLRPLSAFLSGSILVIDVIMKQLDVFFTQNDSFHWSSRFVEHAKRTPVVCLPISSNLNMRHVTFQREENCYAVQIHFE